MKKGRTLFATSCAALLLVVMATGCGASQGGNYGGGHPNYSSDLASAPAPLAALYSLPDKLLPGGTGAFEKRIASLKGYPVVANIWASWCGPCRLEFPILQKLSARYGKRVAFLGVNSQDSDAAAKTFLAEAPVPYPSYTDPDQKVAESIGASLGLPDTAFYDGAGKLVYLKQGPYTRESELEADLRRYALGS